MTDFLPDTSATGSCAPASPLDAATVLEEAADLLLMRGRTRVIRQASDGALCVLGALSLASGDETAEGFGVYDHPATSAVASHVRPNRGGQAAMAVAGWNDHTDDDFEVIDTLRLVAKDLRNG
jgi:hypothetical protein